MDLVNLVRKHSPILVFILLGLPFQNCTDFRAIQSQSSPSQNISDSTNSTSVPGGPVLQAKTQVPAITNKPITSFEYSLTAQSEIRSIECTLDDKTIECSESSLTLPELADGPHIIQIKATDVNAKVAELKVSTLIDTLAPEVKIVSQPEAITRVFDATIKFTISDSGSGVQMIECAVDAEQFKICNDELSLTDLIPGKHKLRIKSADKANNEVIAEVNWDILIGPKKIFGNANHLCVINADDFLVCAQHGDRGQLLTPQLLSYLGKVKFADACFNTTTIVKDDGTVLSEDPRLNTSLFFQKMAIGKLPPGAEIRYVFPDASATTAIVTTNQTFSLNISSQTTATLTKRQDFALIDSSSCITYVNWVPMLRADNVALYMTRTYGAFRTININEPVIALTYSAYLLEFKTFFLTKSGNILAQDYDDYETVPTQAVYKLGELPGAKEIVSDGSSFACLIGGNDQVYCSALEKNQPLNFTQPAGLGAVRQIHTYADRFCGLTFEGSVKCWDKNSMVAVEVKGF